MQLRALKKRRGRTGDERGFTILLALFVLTITTLLLGAAIVAVLNDTDLSRNDLDQKRAYAAAQAGIAQYNYDLNQNPNYWENCPSPSGSVGATDSGSTETYADTPIVASTAPTGTRPPERALARQIMSGLTPKNAGVQITRSASLPSSIDPTS